MNYSGAVPSDGTALSYLCLNVLYIVHVQAQKNAGRY